MFGSLHLLIFGLWLWIFAGASVQAAIHVVIVSSERSEAYAVASQAVISELVRAGISKAEVLDILASEIQEAGSLNPRLFIALGSESANVMANLETRVPVLCALLPRASFERALVANGRRASSQFSAVFLDQPLGRQLDLIQLALPQMRRVGVLWGVESINQAPVLKAKAQARGMELVEATVGRDEVVFDGLKTVLDRSDVLLAIPDPNIYNSSGIQNLLLSSFRARIPMVAFAPAYVRAGALMALHVTPLQIGQQVGVMARGVLQGKSLPPTPVYSQSFNISVNEHVARSLGLKLDVEDLQLRLRMREATP